LNEFKNYGMQLNILVIGSNEEILATVLRIINKNEHWNGIGALTTDDAIRQFDDFDVDIVLLTNGIDEAQEQALCNYFKEKKPSIIIIQHYGGGSGLLSNEIQYALDNKYKNINEKEWTTKF
jgi:vacuolar-type H+-ATPase subunit F/Vma7